MGKEYDVFQKDYAIKSTADIGSKTPEVELKGKGQNQTVTGQVEYYDRLKPYRYTIRAKVIK
jgi:hypothetical protein